MLDKCTTETPINQIHRIPAGILVGDRTTELFGDRVTRKVYGISNGQTVPFAKLCPGKRALIYEQMLNDDAAMEDLKSLTPEAALEQYAFCIYGAADSDPDFDATGKLGKPDNFICSDN